MTTPAQVMWTQTDELQLTSEYAEALTIFDMRKDGKPWHAIATEMGMAVNTARSRFEMVVQTYATDIREYVTTQVARYEELFGNLRTRALNGDVKAMDHYLRALNQFEKLMGIDQPQRVKIEISQDLNQVRDVVNALRSELIERGEIDPGEIEDAEVVDEDEELDLQ